MSNHSSPNSCRSRLDVLTTKLFSKAAPIAAGIKPAMLLRLNNNAPCPYHHASDCLTPAPLRCTELELFDQYQNHLLHSLGLKYMRLYRNQTSALLFFFDPEQLQRVLDCSNNQAFLRSRGFHASCLQSLQQQLIERFRSFPEQFPHEIGLFLGYPLKDVEGFVRGDTPVPIARAPWRVFGDPGESIELMRRVVDLEQRVGNLLRNRHHLNSLALHQVLRMAA